jgi:hypothetical protein
MREVNRAIGAKAEAAFASYVQSLGMRFVKTNLDEDRKTHVDFVLDANAHGGALSVDVKARKKVNGRLCDSLLWVEIESEHNTPWLYAPMLSHIAFQQEKGWLVVPRVMLLKIVQQHYAQATVVTSSTRALVSDTKKYCYRRSNMQREKTLLVDVNLLKPYAINLACDQHSLDKWFKPTIALSA